MVVISMCKHSVHHVNQTIYLFSLVYCNCRHTEICENGISFKSLHIIIRDELILLEHIIKAEQTCLH